MERGPDRLLELASEVGRVLTSDGALAADLAARASASAGRVADSNGLLAIFRDSWKKDATNSLTIFSTVLPINSRHWSISRSDNPLRADSNVSRVKAIFSWKIGQL
jgi:hypothetical protein